MPRRLLCVLIVTVWTAMVAAQAPSSAPDSQPNVVLARGWTALGRGAPVEAVRLADEVLAVNPRDHRALALKIDALSSQDPIRGLDAYERWLGQIRIEDPFLIESIARATLEQIATGRDTGLKLEALESLARAGAPGARDKLKAARSTAAGLGADLALARLGDGEATSRLIDQAGAASQRRGDVIAEALPAAGAVAIPALRRLLADPAGPTRAAAVKALGKMESRAAIEDIRARLQDGDPLVRAWASVGLARLGDSQGEENVAQMLASPVSDLRLIGAEAYAHKGNGPWVSAILPLLKDPNGLIRLQAAELVAPVEPQAARAVLAEAAGDNNPVVRAEATRILAEPAVVAMTPGDWPSLRRWLRDRDAVVRLHAAGIVITATSGIR